MFPDDTGVVRSLDAAMRQLCGRDVRVGARSIDPADEASMPDDERAAVASAVATRRAEFASGRVLLRQLLGSTESITVRHDRTPDLPAGFRGSLAHDRRFVVAAVTDSPAVRAVGVDLDGAGPLDADVASIVVRADESIDPSLAFVVKEAVYKAWHALGGPMLEHHDVRVLAGDARFEAEILGTATGASVGTSTMRGGYARVAGRWLACAVVR